MDAFSLCLGDPSMRKNNLIKRLRPLLEWAWFGLLLLLSAAYIFQNGEHFAAQLRTIALGKVILSGLLLFIGRLILAQVSVLSVQFTGADISFGKSFYVTSLSQLAKYIPGSIWQYVGKAGMYRVHGLTLGQISRALVLENIWVVTSAFLIGLALYGMKTGFPLSVFVLILMLVTWLYGLWLFNRRYALNHRRDRFLAMAGWQFLMWLCFGGSFAILIEADPVQGMGAFGIAFTVGYIVVFAPGGIGIREVLLVALLSETIPVDELLVIAAVHRILWVLTEFGAGLLARLFITRPLTPSSDLIAPDH